MDGWISCYLLYCCSVQPDTEFVLISLQMSRYLIALAYESAVISSTRNPACHILSSNLILLETFDPASLCTSSGTEAFPSHKLPAFRCDALHSSHKPPTDIFGLNSLLTCHTDIEGADKGSANLTQLQPAKLKCQTRRSGSD